MQKRKRKRKRRRVDGVPSLRPPTIAEYASPFRRFLEPIGNLSGNARRQTIALVEVDRQRSGRVSPGLSIDQPSKLAIIPIKMGNMTAAKARQIRNPEIIEAARLSGHDVVRVIGLFALKTSKARKKIGAVNKVRIRAASKNR